MVKKCSVALSEIEMNYVEVGALGPVVLLIHGLTDGLTAYEPIAEALQSVAHVYAIDLRGHGDSSHTPDAYRVVDYVRDVEEFLTRVVDAPALLVGCSLGALVACCTAARGKADVSGILLEDPPLYVGQMPDLGETSFYLFYEYLIRILPEHHRDDGTVEDLLPQVSHPLLDEEHNRILAANLHVLDLDTVRPAMNGTLFDGFDPDEDLPKITCPVRVLIARGDPGGDAVRDEDIERMRARIPHFSHTVWEDTLHAIHYQRPAKMIAEIRSTLGQPPDEITSPYRKETHGQST